MKTLEAKTLTVNHIQDFLDEYEFKQYKSAPNIEFRRKSKNHLDRFHCAFTNYDPAQVYIYSINRRINAVENILDELNQKHPKLIRPKRKADIKTFGFSYESIYDVRNNGFRIASSLPEMQTEEELKQNVVSIKKFLSETAFPLLDKFNDLNELDKEINGDDFWKTDEYMKYNFTTPFLFPRTIIAFFSKNPQYNRIIQYHFEDLEKNIKESEHRDSFENRQILYTCLVNEILPKKNN